MILSISDCIELNGGIIGDLWIGKVLKGSGRGIIKVSLQGLSGGTEENSKILRIVGILGEVWKENRSDRSL